MEVIKGKYLLLISILIMIVVLNFDFTALNMAIPNIIATFNTSLTSAQWTISIFTLMASSCFVLSGKAIDIFQKECIFLIGAIVFLAATLAAALSVNILILIVSRAIQGISFAFTFNSALLMVKSISKQNKIGMGISFVVATASVTQGIAPIVSGLLMQYFSWRSIFWINIPLLIFCISSVFFSLVKNNAVSSVFLKNAQAYSIRSKYVFISIIIPPIFIYTLESMAQNSFSSNSGIAIESVGSLLISVTAITLYKIRHLIKENMAFIVSIIVRFIFNVCWSALLFAIPLYLQNIKLISISMIGLIMLSMTITTFITSLLTAKCIDNLDIKPALIHTLLALLLINIYAVFFSKQVFMLIPTLIGYGVIASFILALTTKLAMNSLPSKLLGISMGYYYSASLLGNTVGIFIITTIINRTTHALLAVKQMTHDPLLYLFQNGSKPLSSLHFPKLVSLLVSNYQFAFSISMAFCAALILCALVITKKLS